MEVHAMKPTLPMLLILAVAASASAQDRSKPTDAVPPVQAPPTLDDPSGAAVTLPTPQAQAKTAVTDNPATAAEKAAESPPLPPEVQAAADAAELPVVTVRQDGADTIEEYRKHGKLYFVRVLSDNGPAKYYVNDPAQVPPDMRQITGPSGVVQPVYFKLFDWK
jgi:hypothetical protein